MKRIALLAVAVALLLAWNASAFSDPGSRPHEPHPQPSPAVLGTTLPSDFPIIINPYLGVPILGFGASESRGVPSRGVPSIVFLSSFCTGITTRLFRPPAIPSGISTILPNFFSTTDTHRASCGVWDIRETNATS